MLNNVFIVYMFFLVVVYLIRSIDSNNLLIYKLLSY